MVHITGPDGIIKTINLNYRAGNSIILKDINMQIPQGKITVIIGPSGSGKSTLLQLLTGLLRPTSGKIYVKDTDLTSLSYEELINLRRKTMGIMFQELGLFDWLTVEENIAFPLKIHSSKNKVEIKKTVEEIIHNLHLRGAEKLYPDQLSGGMRKRVALGRILSLNPEILLLDEPTSGLDPVISASIEELIKEINSSTGKTFVVISHTIDTTLNIADYIGVIFRGKLIEFGRKDEILASPNPIVKQYFSREPHGPITESI